MNQIARCDWLPERARWRDTARSRFLASSRKIKDHFLQIFFCVFMDLDFVSVHKHAKKNAYAWSITHTYKYWAGVSYTGGSFGSEVDGERAKRAG